ncbi:MAG: enoyl-CoA hydratase-related protein, partial [Gammaproteobacteria bacterium]|nr:enoyl-CoA hydratase-related protein [Gammaproteobacteria bacterium]
MNPEIQTSVNGAVLEVVLNRPKANAIDAVTSRKMGEVFANFRDDPALRVAVLTGAGEKFFCAGWDLKAAAEGEQADADFGVGGFGGLQEVPVTYKPVRAPVTGSACVGRLVLAPTNNSQPHGLRGSSESRFCLKT